MTAPLRVARLPPRQRRRLGLVVLVVLLALLLLFSNLVPLVAEWLWFQALGYERVFTTRLAAEAVLGVGVGGLVFAFLYVNLRIAQRGLVPNPLVVQLSSGAAAVDVTRLFRRLALPTALGLALLFGMGAAGGWLGVLQFLHRTPFGVTDPVFGRDVGYYVFTVPVIAGATGLFTAVTTLTLLATIMLYVLRRDIVVFRRQVTVEPSARVHLAVLIALLFVLVGLRVYFVRLPELLYSTTGPLVGASYADLHAQLTGLRLAGLAAVASGALVLWGARSHRLARSTLLAVGLYLGVSLLGVALYPTLVQKLVVAPNELVKETPQLASHIAATRRAWGLDSVVTRALAGEVPRHDAVQPPGPPRRRDVGGELRRFLQQLVRRHDQFLDQRRVERDAEQGHAEVEPDREQGVAGQTVAAGSPQHQRAARHALLAVGLYLGVSLL